MDYEWKKCESYFSAHPATRWGATLTPIDNKLYLIGGYLFLTSFIRSCWRTYFNKIVSYNLSLKTWETTEGSISSRSGHVATALFNKYILIHGGRFIEEDGTSHILGDFICLDTTTDKLKNVNIDLKNDIIGKLCYHSWCVDNKLENNPIIYIFGGRNEERLSIKFFKLSVMKQINTICIDICELELSKSSPSPRIFHTFNFYDNNHISLIGGCNLDYKETYSDLWIYNTKKNKWDEDEDEEYGKSVHTVECIDKKTLFIFGGMCNNYETVNYLEIKSYSSDDNDDDYNNDSFNSFLLTPGSRRGHSSCHIGRVMFIFGGFNGSDFYNDLYMFGKRTDIEDLEAGMFNREMNIYCNKYSNKIHIPNTLGNNDNDNKKTKCYYYDSRLLSYYPKAYIAAKRKGYNDLTTVTNELCKMIDNCENPVNEINEISFSDYLDLSGYRKQSKFDELQKKIREKTEQQHNHYDINFLCRICNKKVITHVLIPCGCYCVCENCAKSLVGNNCPSCKKNVESNVKLFVDNNQ